MPARPSRCKLCLGRCAFFSRRKVCLSVLKEAYQWNVSALGPTSLIAAEIAPGVLLDSRRALIHPQQGWMAIADLHYGYEVHRSLKGALLPQWGMKQCQDTLHALLNDYLPQRLILVGDIMDGRFSVKETGLFLDQLRSRVPDLVLIEGNHDRPALKKGWQLTPHHQESGFIFLHGHQGTAPPSDLMAQRHSASALTVISGHEHPAISLGDGAGLRLKLPALIQQEVQASYHHWILPAFSPWAAGGSFHSPHPHLGTWACTPHRVWRIS